MRQHLLVFIIIISSFLSYSQTGHSWDGKDIAPNTNLRILNIFVNVIYDEHPGANVVDSSFWPSVTNPSLEGVNVPGTIPTYLLDFMDTSYVCGQTHGMITRLYGESSFDSLQLIGDFIVVNVREKRVLNTYHQFKYNYIAQAAVDVINENGFCTIYGHNSIEDYDYGHDGKFYYTQVLIRNISKDYGSLAESSGCADNCLLNKYISINNVNHLFTEYGTLQNVGGRNVTTNPTCIVSHEISHGLFGKNEFHTSGGNHRGSGSNTMPWMSIQGGYGLMGAAGSGLVCCNGYERWRMHWKHPSSPYYILSLIHI